MPWASMIENLIDTAPFIDDALREECKKYFRQIPLILESQWFYSQSSCPFFRQADIIENLDFSYSEIEDDAVNIRVLEDQTCMLVSNTCDMDLKDKSRGKHILVALVVDYDVFASQEKTDSYTNVQWENYLESVRKNLITDILFIPENGEIKDSVVYLDKVFSCTLQQLLVMQEKDKIKKILSLSQVGHYYFLIKLTHHFARYENKEETGR